MTVDKDDVREEKGGAFGGGGTSKEGKLGMETYFAACFRFKAIIFWSISVGAMSLSLRGFAFSLRGETCIGTKR
jgi:hypothetical protein